MASEVFALTDEQIVGLAPEDGDPQPTGATRQDADTGTEQAKERRASLRASGQAEGGRYTEAKGAQAGMLVPQVAPEWLTERMKDPWCGDQATEFWEATQNAQRDAAAYREVFATPEDARALKELYPGGIGEAKSAAERARALEEIDAAFDRGDSAARMQLAQRMMAQNPAAFREMVEAGLRLLGQASGEHSVAISNQPSAIRNREESAIAQAGVPVPRESATAPGTAVPQEVVRAYGEFEQSANAELEKSVGGAIHRAMEQALPNLRAMKAQGAQRDGDAAPLQERLAVAVREDIEAGLKSDRQLGEQVARLLAGRRFDREARAQVVRLIDARAQQLVPGAVKRVVSSWTSATLAAKGKDPAPPRAQNKESARVAVPSSRGETERAKTARASSPGRRFDYGRVSDEEIVGL